MKEYFMNWALQEKDDKAVVAIYWKKLFERMPDLEELCLCDILLGCDWYSLYITKKLEVKVIKNGEETEHITFPQGKPLTLRAKKKLA